LITNRACSIGSFPCGFSNKQFIDAVSLLDFFTSMGHAEAEKSFLAEIWMYEARGCGSCGLCPHQCQWFG